MGQEEWIIFRNKISKFENCLEEWRNKILENGDQVPVVKWIKSQVDQYKVWAPLDFLTISTTLFNIEYYD